MLGNDEGPPGRFQGCKRGVSRGCPCCVGPQIRKLGQFMLAKSLKSKFASSLKLVSNPTLMPQVNICEMYCPEVMVKQVGCNLRTHRSHCFLSTHNPPRYGC
eukprot:scaffold105313_cov12-Tisochrysis_lutea.AAC.1